ncbi:hypothetical protein SAMN02745126_04875 [Enhydrobacter aerosaccus]|uniref:Uncharacterized protein n=1 Tax=Enhydrobacter aerosaccus TaxID=225324 RepID=A0A1T4SP41_9HYPH|nr:hypothetical protein SAMN02745126_04875 [Enhydrobacter aerosaccus]
MTGPQSEVAALDDGAPQAALMVAVDGWSVMRKSLWLLVSGHRTEHRTCAANRQMVLRTAEYQGMLTGYICADVTL